MFAPLARSLRLREGEERLLVGLGGFLFLTASAETLLNSARNGLFLSVFPARLVPHVMVAAAIVTALAAIAFTGVMERFQRRVVAVGLVTVLTTGLVLSFFAFRQDARSAFAIYLWARTVEVLALTHAWDYMGDLVTGRQAKRLLPLAGAGASVATVATGLSVGPLAVAASTEGLLWMSGLLLVASLGFLWALPQPRRAALDERDSIEGGPVGAFVRRAGQGFRSLAGHPLLRLLTVSTVLLVVTSALIDVQWKLAVQEAFQGAEIARTFGFMEAAIGMGALVLQILASRVLFPRLGVSGSNLLQGTAVVLLILGFALSGTLIVVAALRFLDEALGEAVEKPARQISLIPFPPSVKNAAFTTLDGVLQPLSIAGGALLALLLLADAEPLLPWFTLATGVAAIAVMSGHRTRYLRALEGALTRHMVDLEALSEARLRIDRSVLDVIDRFLDDADPTVVVFSASLLRDLPTAEAAPRALALLEHPVPEVRIEAAGVLGTLADDPGDEIHARLVHHLRSEVDPDVLGALVVAMGSLGRRSGETDLGPFLEHPEPAVRKAALTALSKEHPDAVRGHLERLLDAGATGDRQTALSVVGALGYESFLPAVAEAVMDDDLRSSALAALASFGPGALPALDRLLARTDLDLPVRRTLVTTLAAIDDPEARAMLLRLVDHQELGPAALTSLRRLRSAGEMARVPPGDVRHLLRAQVERGARYALVRVGLLRTDPAGRGGFVAREMADLRVRYLHRALAVLALGYDADSVTKVETAIFSSDPRRRGNALDYLEGVLTSEDAGLVVPLAEWEPGDSLDSLMALTLEGGRAIRTPLDVLAEDDRWWPQALARYAAGLDDGDEDMIPLIEKVMLLKGSELFRGFPGDELAGIAELATEQHADAGEVIFEQGDRGDAYYLVVRGGVSIVRDDHELAVLRSREGFGEMAILDQDTRSATARTVEPTTLLVLDRDSFDQLVERNPAVARGIYRVLTQRLRSTLARVAAGR